MRRKGVARPYGAHDRKHWRVRWYRRASAEQRDQLLLAESAHAASGSFGAGVGSSAPPAPARRQAAHAGPAMPRSVYRRRITQAAAVRARTSAARIWTSQRRYRRDRFVFQRQRLDNRRLLHEDSLSAAAPAAANGARVSSSDAMSSRRQRGPFQQHRPRIAQRYRANARVPAFYHPHDDPRRGP